MENAVVQHTHLLPWLAHTRVPPIGQVLGTIVVHELEARHADDSCRPASSSGPRLQGISTARSSYAATHEHAGACGKADADVAVSCTARHDCTLWLLLRQLQ